MKNLAAVEQPNLANTLGVYLVPEVAKRLRVSKYAIYESIKRNELPHVKIGRRVVVPIAAFEAWLSRASLLEPHGKAAA